MSRGKKSLMMLAGSICIAVALLIWPVQTVLEVKTTVVQRGELIQTLLLNGKVCYTQQQPCISPKSGRVSDVYVQAGQAVGAGDLLFKMDTAAEEQALSSLYEMKFAHRMAPQQFADTFLSFNMKNEIEWQTLETQLLAAIEASQIRAAADGVIEAVYVQPGKYVAETSLLGSMRGVGMQIAASAYAGDVSGILPGAAGIATDDQMSIPVVLAGMTAVDSSGMQILDFEAAEGELKAFGAGAPVQIELVVEVEPVSALIPLSAIDADGRVWIVEDGKAYVRELGLGKCSRTHVSADLEWTDRTLVLQPERYVLKDGISVQVSK